MLSMLRISEAYCSNFERSIPPTGTSNTWSCARDATACINAESNFNLLYRNGHHGLSGNLFHYFLAMFYLQALSDKVLGGSMLFTAAFVFVYYTAWALVLVREVAIRHVYALLLSLASPSSILPAKCMIISLLENGPFVCQLSFSFLVSPPSGPSSVAPSFKKTGRRLNNPRVG